jgi:hypothetical protein
MWNYGQTVSYMRNSIVFSLIFLLALDCFAAPLQLGGDTGRSILGTIDNNTINATNSTNQTDLWSWGKVPVGHSLNASTSKLDTNPMMPDSLLVVPARSVTNN